MFVTIHGHFYQPPRENPWTGQVPRQESAHPHHDWNDRIAAECYAPNCRSRVLDHRKRIVGIVDNLETIHFDFGPTLLRWLERERPRVYHRILEADKKSIRRNGGHGNAIAQAYNHMILPLANHRDKRTQILWGLRDFESRFGRKSESLWLPETAIDPETVRLLISCGIRYLILSPRQAASTKPLSGGESTDVTHERVDTTTPYRLFSDEDGDRSKPWIDVFFYDGMLSHEISFSDLLRSAPVLADRFVRAGAGRTEDRLIHVATDGEVYGHHVPFGDMCLASVIEREALPRGIVFTNYGQYLDLHPPQHEVKLDYGPEGFGSSWSCAHGIERWRGDCGCSTGGPADWRQDWREPLRSALDRLRDRLIEVFHTKASVYVKDAWAARDDYIEILLSEGAREPFLERHARRRLADSERRELWRLLESQHQAMLMFTSCAWFFADLARLEVVQNLAHAARAIELAHPLAAGDLEEEFVDLLSAARSNLPDEGTGADLWHRKVRPMRRYPVHFAIDAVGQIAGSIDPRHPPAVEIDLTPRGEIRLEDGFEVDVTVTDRWTKDAYPFRVRADREEDDLVRFSVARPTRPDVPAENFSLDEVSETVRIPVIRAMLSDLLAREDDKLTEILEESMPLLRRFHARTHILPSIFESLAEHLYRGRCERIAQELARIDPRMLTAVHLREATADLTSSARSIGLDLDCSSLARVVEVALDASLQSVQDSTTGDVTRAIDLLTGATEIGLQIRRTDLEERVYDLLNSYAPILAESLAGRIVEESKIDPNALLKLSELSNLALPMPERV